MTIYIGYIPEGKNTNVEIRKWYNKPWTMIFRPTNKKIALNLASKIFEAANNKNILFNPYEKSILFETLKKNKWKIESITESCYSNNFALISSCINAIGIFIKEELNYKNISQILFNTGRFNKITNFNFLNSSDNLKIGDILVCENDIAVVVSYEEYISNPEQQKGNTNYVGKEIGEAISTHKKNEIRNGAGEKYKIIDYIKKNDTIKILGLTENGWYKIVWPQSIAGYAYTNSKNYNYKGKKLEPTITTIVNYTVKIIVDSLRIEKNPHYSDPYLGILKKETTHKIIREKNNYGLLQSGKGWICLDGVEKV